MGEGGDSSARFCEQNNFPASEADRPEESCKDSYPAAFAKGQEKQPPLKRVAEPIPQFSKPPAEASAFSLQASHHGAQRSGSSRNKA